MVMTGMSEIDDGTSKMVNCSDFVGVTTVVVPPCQELLSSLTKLLRLLLRAARVALLPDGVEG